MSPRRDSLVGKGRGDLDGVGGGGLGVEIGKRGSFDSIEQRVHLGLLRTSALSEGPVLAVIREHGLSMSTYNILRILRGSGEAGRRATEIAKDMVVRVPDVPRLIARLDSDGFLSRESDPADGRRVIVRITKAGREKLSAMESSVIASHDVVLGGLTVAELKQLDELLAKVRECMLGACDEE